MEDEIDPYEKQLLAVFKSCDSKGNGVLDKSSFIKLCDTLQLEEGHRTLITTRLCDNGNCNVVFSQFRDALLAVLASLKSPTDEFDSPSPIGYENAGMFVILLHLFIVLYTYSTYPSQTNKHPPNLFSAERSTADALDHLALTKKMKSRTIAILPLTTMHFRRQIL